MTFGRRARQRGPAVAALLCAGAVALAGCSGIASDSTVAGQAGTPGPTPTGETTPEAPPRTDAEQLQPGFVTLAERAQNAGHRGLTVAWAPVGAPEAVQQLGSTDTVDAWSTIKVPIALAAVQQREGRIAGAVSTDIDSALRFSDNDSALRLWNGLGRFGDPAAIVDDLLRSTGDRTTSAAHNRGGGRVPFGLTDWAVADSARFAAGLPCEPYSHVVLTDMRNVTAEHQWGLGAVDTSAHTSTDTSTDNATETTGDVEVGQEPAPESAETSGTEEAGGTNTAGPVEPALPENAEGLHVDQVALKGGWGVSDTGYLMRQIGVLRLDSGSGVAVALSVQPAGDNHERGAEVLSDAAQWLARALSPADTGRCAVTPPEQTTY